MPPVVTGAIVALIGLNLAPAAWNWVKEGPLTAVVTIVSICLITVLFKGIIGRLSILFGVLIGYVAAILQNEVDFSRVAEASWIGLPEFSTPAFDPSTLGLFVPVVFVLIAENVGHVKSVSAMTGRDLDGITGRALIADGCSTMLAGAGGGSGPACTPRPRTWSPQAWRSFWLSRPSSAPSFRRFRLAFWAVQAPSCTA